MITIQELLAIPDPVARAQACNVAILASREFERDALAIRNEAVLDQMDSNPDVGYGRAAKASGIGRSTAANLHYQADHVRERSRLVKVKYKGITVKV